MSNPSEIDELLRYFGIQSADLQALAKLREPLEDNADEMVRRFYVHLDTFPETRELLADPEVRRRLLASQRDYLLSLANPEIDQAYVEQRARIGMTHERIGLDTRWYLGAYSLYFSLVMPIIREHLKDDPNTMDATLIALDRRLRLDSEIAIRQYIDRRERELKRLNSQLRAEGRSLTQEFQETQQHLVLTEARAREAEQLASVATLISGLAHEIGTPMGVIRGHAEALDSAVEGERASWRLNMILEQIDRITGIIQALLNMARPRESLRTNVDLAACVNSTLAFLTEKLKRRNVTVSKAFESNAEIVADPEKLQQVFLNLLINAIDSMPQGGELSIAIDQIDSSIRVRIADSGIGISSDQLKSVFDPFYTTKPAGRGNGLGLVVVKGIVDEHEGSIDIRSTLGEGTEFSIRLPIS
jgi:signal transduction histidine kinase